MDFSWSNFSKNTLRELARSAGLRVTQAEQELRDRFGEPPSPEIIDVAWPVLREGWVLRTPDARESIVNGLRAAKLGKTQLKVKSRTGQMEYLRSCRVSDALRRIAHEALCEAGSHTNEAQGEASSQQTSGDDSTVTAATILQQACSALLEGALPAVEHAVCSMIGGALRGVIFPVPLADANDVAASVVTAAIVAIRDMGERELDWNLEVPAHRAWVLAGAKRLATDPAECEAVVQHYFEEVGLLVTENDNSENAQLTATSMFFTVLGFGTSEDVPQDAQRELIGGLHWLLETLQEPAADDDGGDDDDNDDEAAEEPAESPADLTLDAFIDTILRQRPGVAGPARSMEQTTSWFVSSGSATIRVDLIRYENEPPIVRYQSALLTGISFSAALLDTINMINRDRAFYKAYLSDDKVILEYDHLVDDLSETRLVYTLGSFLNAADQFDTILQDRFGGQTQAADVKAHFNV